MLVGKCESYGMGMGKGDALISAQFFYKCKTALKNNVLENEATDLEKVFLIHLSDKQLKSINLNSMINNSKVTT